MATAPQIKLRDESGLTVQEIVFSTNLEYITIDGTIDTNTVAVQVSINGSPFVTDNTLVEINGVDFTFPSPVSYPDGFSLDLGVNSIRLRAIDILGSVSPISSATITRVPAEENGETLIPTGVRVRRRRDAIDLLAAKTSVALIDDGGLFAFRGFNFYASATEGTGYIKINAKPVTEASAVYEEDLLQIDGNNVVFDLDESTTTTRVKVTQEDAFGNELGLVLDRTTNVATVGQQLKFTQTLEIRGLTEFVFFRHNRKGGANHINSDQFLDVDDTEPLYYVVTGVYFSPTTNTEFETPYSQEVVGLPLIIDTGIRDLPGRTQLQVALDFVTAVQRVDAEITLIPGSTTRDVTIDPFSSEAERLWFIADFVHRSQSFLTLLQIDDANNDGVTDAVAGSAYKQALKAALGLRSDSAVQTLIDTQFDKLAGNFTRKRLPGRPAVGQAVYYTTTRPTSNITIASGSLVATDADTTQGLSAARFTVGGTYVLVAADADAYFNFETQRYELTVDISAESAGASGNRSAGAIKNVVTNVGGLKVTNTESTVFGSDRESNHDLAIRSQLAFVSVDAGTEGGYAKTTTEQVGIVKNKIVKSGDRLMMRDYDDVRHKHIGGKVDIYVQGLRERTVTERFAFTFAVARDIRCQILNATNLIFRVLDNRVTIDTPLVEILDNAAKGLGVRNASKGQDYDLTGVTILDHETFQLNTVVPQPVTAIDDVVLADFRFRSTNQHTFLLQPVRRVTSVVGEVSGTLVPEQLQLFKVDDPLLEGESTLAQDYLVISQLGGIPTGATITVNDEQHVIIGFFEERLASIGVNTATIRVFSQDRTIEYDGPGSATPDFEIIEGTSTTPASIKRTATSDIVSGSTVSIDYDHDENFTVTYVINDLLQQLQRTVNRQRHITADVLVKQAQLNSVDIETTVQLKLGAAKDTVDPAIRTSVSTELNTKLIGEGVAVSDVINAIDSTTGVDFQVVPLARMGYADGSRKLREPVNSSAAPVSSLNIGGNNVFILTSALQFPTTDGGGLVTEHKGVFQDDVGMVLSNALSTVGENPNQAYIIGADGAVINGYSDDATLMLAGFTSTENIEAERVRRTANRVVISLTGAGSPVDAPENHDYTASYIIRNHRGPSDLTSSQVEFLDLGKFTLTYRTATS